MSITEKFFENQVGLDRWLTAKEAAEYLRLSVNALRIMVHRGHLRAYKMGRRLRFKLSELTRIPQLTAAPMGVV